MPHRATLSKSGWIPRRLCRDIAGFFFFLLSELAEFRPNGVRVPDSVGPATIGANQWGLEQPMERRSMK